MDRMSVKVLCRAGAVFREMMSKPRLSFSTLSITQPRSVSCRIASWTATARSHRNMARYSNVAGVRQRRRSRGARCRLWRWRSMPVRRAPLKAVVQFIGCASAGRYCLRGRGCSRPQCGGSPNQRATGGTMDQLARRSQGAVRWSPFARTLGGVSSRNGLSAFSTVCSTRGWACGCRSGLGCRRQRREGKLGEVGGLADVSSGSRPGPQRSDSGVAPAILN